MISDDAYKELEKALGSENVTREPAALDCYAWQPMINDNPEKWVARPAAVVLPGSVDDVREIVKICGKNGLKFKAFATGWGVYSACSGDNVVQVDLRRMDKIIEIDEKNMYALVEPYVSGAQLQAECMKLGLNTHIIGAGPVCSPLASATSGWGVGWDGVSMSYSGRNPLGVEWVLPDGEVLKLGTPGSGAGWFNGDGPGPSLRGIMRGSTGALSGLGIFTKCAVKLFNWPGPPEINVEGLLLDARSEVPENAAFYLTFFENGEKLSNAVYEMGNAELGYLAGKTSVAAYVGCFAPRLLRLIGEKTKAVKSIFNQTMRDTFMVLIMGDTKEETAHQVKVLKKITDDNGGLAIEVTGIKQIAELFFMSFLRSSAIPLAFRMGGMFGTALGRNDGWDAQMRWFYETGKLKDKHIKSNTILDDLVDNPFMAVYENNMWSHCEQIYQYDTRDRKHLESLTSILLDYTVLAMEQCMEPFSACDARLRALVDPIMGHYNKWQKKISESFDPNRAADTWMYCDEQELDLEKIDPNLKRRVEEAFREMEWTRTGPKE